MGSAAVRRRRRQTLTKPKLILTIGHSTRDLEEFIRLLKAHGVTRVGDVPTVPRSRHKPQFNKETLPHSLDAAGISYEQMPGLGGFRRAKAGSPNLGWRNSSFRGYADYVQTAEFDENLRLLADPESEDRVVLWITPSSRCRRSTRGQARR